MRTILYLVRKEFTQIFRNRFISRAIFGIPLVQMIILVPAVTFEIDNIKLCVIDKDMTSESRDLVSRLQGSEFFLISHTTFSEQEADDLLHKNRCDLILNIPRGFSNDIMTENRAKVMVIANAINASSAQLSWAYISGVLRDFNADLVMDNLSVKSIGTLPTIKITNRFWYNPTLNYKYYMLPGILVILVTAIGLLLAGLNVVKEKEMGTIEQLNVTPIRKYQFIIAKLVPFLVIGLVDLAFGLLLGKILFDIPFAGSLGLLFFFAVLYLIAVLGLALFLSTLSSTQQQYLFVVFFILLIFILMSGIFTPAESMPLWAQKFNLVNPAAYFMRVIRMIMLKGSGFIDILPDIRGLAIIALTTVSLAIWRYRKRV
ncbi:MAG TPA: ABC transporter permease [Bacteroidales bacterium]|nr:ABC transporter permease [Bacteroidales bacterium]